jgi:hypothetical protein
MMRSVTYTVSYRLQSLGISGVLVDMAESGLITVLRCQMSACYCPGGGGQLGVSWRLRNGAPADSPAIDNSLRIRFVAGAANVDVPPQPDTFPSVEIYQKANGTIRSVYLRGETNYPSGLEQDPRDAAAFGGTGFDLIW